MAEIVELGGTIAERRTYEVLYRARPAWEVGQGTPLHRAGEHYPDDYGGRVTAVREIGSGPSLRNESDRDRPVAVLSLTAEEAALLGERKRKILDGQVADVNWEDKLGAIAPLVPQSFRTALEAEETATDDEAARNGPLCIAIHSFLNAHRLALPRPEVHSGTELYAVKTSPGHNDDTQSGAASGQTVTLTTGGLGGADAWKGGYLSNATESEIRAIVSHTDTTVTLEGDLTNWTDGDDLDIYDAWSTIQGTLDQLWADQGSAAFASVQEIRIHAGTYNESPDPNDSLTPSPEFYLWMRGNAGDFPTINLAALVNWQAIEYSRWSNVRTTGAAFRLVQWLRADNCEFASIVAWTDSTFEFEDCVFTTPGVAASYINGVHNMVFRRCKFESNAVVTIRQPRGGHILLESCLAEDGLYLVGVDSAESQSSALRVTILNCIAYGRPLVRYNLQAVDWLVVRNTICQGGAYVYDFDKVPRVQIESDRNCFYGQSTDIANWGGSDKNWAAWQALGYDANSKNEDPKLTDPGAGDFSLASDSPCRGAGAGAGVTAYYDGTAADPYHPNIGATGTAQDPPAIVTPVIASAVDDETGTSATLTLTADDSDDVLQVWYRKSTESAWSDGGTRTGSGEKQVTGLALAHYEFICEASRNDQTSNWSAPKWVVVTTGTGGETASGLFSLPMEHLRTLLAESSTFQAWVGAVDAADAKNDIHLVAEPASNLSRPFALVYQAEDLEERAIAGGTVHVYEESGAVHLLLEADISQSYQAEDKHADAELEFTNKVGAIISEMKQLAGSSGYLAVNEFRLEAGPRRPEEDEEQTHGAYYQALFLVRWGP